MQIAICSEDGKTYSAFEFSQLPSVELERKRRLLHCPECGRPAFFRAASPIGRGPCFGAWPHADGCGLAAQDYDRLQGSAGEDQDMPIISAGKIIVDLNYGAPNQTGYVGSTGGLPDASRASRKFGNGHWSDAPMYRRPSSLLRNLIELPAFANSDQPIVVEGYGEIAARDFFVPLESASSQHSGKFKGYWGLIADAKFALDKSLWLNSGGRGNISFCIDASFVDVITQRHRINDLEDFAGGKILVLGTPRVSPNGKLHMIINSPEFVSLRLL